MLIGILPLLASGLLAVAEPPTPRHEPPCSGGSFGLAQRFVGTWKEFTVTQGGEVLAGTLRARFEAGGCAFSQRFESPDGGFSFVSLGHVDPSSQRWRETFVLSNGRVATYEWRAEGDEVVMERLGGDPADRRRLRIANLTSSSYDVIEERSRDGARTWAHVELTRTRRVP